MAKKKTYYYLKISEDFFKAKEIKLLRKNAGGDTYAIIYQRIMILSLMTDGKLYFENIGNSFAEEIALELDESIENVEMTLAYLKGKKLIEFSEVDNSYDLVQVPALVGAETNWARYKALKKEESRKILPIGGESQPDVHQDSTYIRDRVRDKDRVKDRVKDTDSLFDEYFQIFSEFTKGTKPQPRIDAMHEFSELLPEQRDKALVGALNYVTWYQNSGNDIQYSKNAAVFLKDMIFFDYQTVPDEPKKKFTKSTKGIPEWGDEYKLIKAGVDTTGMTQNEMYKLVGEMGLRNA